ncbi:MAG: flagellar biosynthesis protein FlhB [Parvularculaceae bacterium]
MAEDQDQKTEEPSQKKLSEAKRKGEVPKSMEINNWFVLTAGGFALAMLAKPIAGEIANMGRAHFGRMHEISVDGAALVQFVRILIVNVALLMAAFAALMIVAAVAGNLVQSGLVFSAERMKPKLSKLSPISGAKKIFGLQGLVNLGKGVLKIALVVAVIFLVLWPDRGRLEELVFWDIGRLAPFIHSEAVKITTAVLALLTVVAALDYAYQRYEFYKRQRMTKQEVKDEHKQSDGDPLVKAKIRQVRQERAQQRMMANVPDASVVITNPTHYAVALKYEAGQAAAPLCVAKGVDEVALRIREVADEHGVPIVENPPLARALFGSVDLDEEIPVEHYQAVAKVIGFVMRKARGR